MTAANARKVVGDTALLAWLPAQERVARWAGEVRRILSNARAYRRELTALIDWVDATAERWNRR